MERLFTEASLSDSYIYSEFNRSSNISTTIASAIKTGVKLDSTFIEQQLIQCKRSRISPISEKVLAAYENGEITLHQKIRVKRTVYNNEGKEITGVVDATLGRLIFNEILPQDLGFLQLIL
jgi:hypothetical protein